MPQQTVYIREEDMELWKATPHKSELVHRALNGKIVDIPPAFQKAPPIVKKPNLNIVKKSQEPEYVPEQ